MLKPKDLLGKKSKIALRVIQKDGDYFETVAALESLMEGGNITEVEEIGMLLENYTMNHAPDPDQIVADLQAELDAIAAGAVT
jgi:hypothetical protein